MNRKLYALLILTGAIGSLVLVYLYFFVYYTAIVTINVNVPAYKVELYSPSTAQRWTHDCPEEVCVISDVSPFQYNISIIKTGYETKLIPAKIRARGKESFIIDLEKKVSLESVPQENLAETKKEKIKRLREEKLYYARFQLDNELLLTFQEKSDRLEMQLRTNDTIRDISDFEIVKKIDIHAEYVSQTQDIFLKIGTENYIFNLENFTLNKLPFDLPISYIKKGNSDKHYLIVTQKGSFLYDISENNSEFQYLFKDFLYLGDDIIGIIYDDETQKKSNFNLSEAGNLIIKYSPKDKTKKILKTTHLNISRLEWKDEKIIFSVGDEEYELTNFD